MGRRAAFAVLLLGVTISLRRAVCRAGGMAPGRNGRVHVHHCFLCEGEWAHWRPCPEGRARLCPWCLAGSRRGPDGLPERISSAIDEIGPARRGRHTHSCLRCLTTWSHGGAGTGGCTAGDRAALPGCPECRRRRRRVSRGDSLRV
ncbi:MAG TPA: hypothetical protein VHF87_17965 [Methylomirabilota bacterium]|nr:hypothetical protein [Methylomirabilota bacterium]